MQNTGEPSQFEKDLISSTRRVITKREISFEEILEKKQDNAPKGAPRHQRKNVRFREKFRVQVH